MRLAGRFFLLSMVASLGLAPAPVQQASLSAAVRAFVRVDAAVVALTDVTVIDGTGAPGRPGQTVVLRDGLIEWVGPVAEATIPEGAEVLALDGYTVLPGLVMVHEHMFYPSGQGTYNQMQYSFPRLYLAAGATTIRTGGSRDPYGDLNLKAAIDAGRVVEPDIDVTGPYVNGPGLGSMFVNAVEGPDDAVALVHYWADEGATSFKAYMQISRAEFGAVLEVIHGRGLKMTGHLCSVTYAEAAELGIDNLEHGVAVTSTLPVFEISTLNGARYLEIDDRTGSIVVGKVADLMVVRGNPAVRIGDIRNVEIVFKAGIGYDSQALFDSVKGTVGIR